MSSSLFVNQISVIDSALLHPQRGLTGVSWIVDVLLEGELNNQGMLFDFGPAKQRIKQIIDECADHKLLVAQADSRLRWHDSGNDISLEYQSDSAGLLNLRSPVQAFCMLEGATANAENLARYLEAEILEAMPDNITAIEIKLRNELIDGAAYAYCHGLKKHDGNCQRIAHGHRSRIEIFTDGERSTELEQLWAQNWQDIYVGNTADLANSPEDSRLRFAYDADQGHFEIELNAARCVLIKTESTVENIAAHIANELKCQQPATRFTVRAFEGVNKGAIAHA